MTSHKCDSVIITCIDFRFQPYIDEWLDKQFKAGSYDRISWAGGIKNLDDVMEQIGISHRLHCIKNAFLINHENCGAYGQAETAEKHAQDLKNAAEEIENKFPEVEVKTYYLHLDGTFEQIQALT
ncbi:hypothetical protein KKE78_04690 [Patescibacteria group bacterium]|nr:hypothetical protein [Patescibacteria group bacterium]